MAAPAGPLPVVIDTDCGVDDAYALWAALDHPALEVVAVTAVWGNCDVTTAAANVLRVLEAAGRGDIPVAVGAAVRSGPAPKVRNAALAHGDDGLGNTHRPPPAGSPLRRPAVDLLREIVDGRPGEVAVATLGPLTNVAAVLAADPAWAQRVRTLVTMGGSVGPAGPGRPAVEGNVASDPAAAAAVVRAAWPEPPLLVGLDVTLEATLTDREFALLAERRTPAAAFLDEPMRFYRPFASRFTAPECPCHDLLAVLALADPDLLTHAPVLPLAVDTNPGERWGATVVAQTAAGAGAQLGCLGQDAFRPWRVALGADVERFRAHARALLGGN